MSAMERKSKRGEKKEQLTSRQKQIIQILTKFTASRPVTVAMISEMLGLSSRTILREIPHVEKWLAQNDFHFVRKPGVGLILNESVENQKLILELLEVESVTNNYSKDERCRRILGELLQQSGGCTERRASGKDRGSRPGCSDQGCHRYHGGRADRPHCRCIQYRCRQNLMDNKQTTI